MTKTPDALKGIKHHTDEELQHDVTLKPFEHLVLPDSPHSLNVRVFNTDPTSTYVVRIYKVVDSVSMRKRKEK